MPEFDPAEDAHRRCEYWRGGCAVASCGIWAAATTRAKTGGAIEKRLLRGSSPAGLRPRDGTKSTVVDVFSAARERTDR